MDQDREAAPGSPEPSRSPAVGFRASDPRVAGRRSAAVGGPLSLWTLAVSLGLPSPAAQADIHRCEADDGTIHFTNDRPRGSRCTLVVRSRRPQAPPPGATGLRRPGRSATPADRYTRYDSFFREASLLYHLPESLLRAVARVESDFHPGVVSSAGAIGLMQLMPATAASMGVQDPFDPRQNILGGARFLRILANRFNGDLVLTIAAYNAGDGAVLRHNGVPPYAETRRYVRRVLRHYYDYRAAE